MSDKKFACAINCIDGRTQDPVNHWLEKEYRVDFVDEITEAGVDKILADNEPAQIMEDIISRVKISIDKHGSSIVAIVGHFDCAGNPGDRDHHIEHLRRCLATVSGWELNVETVALWVNENWEVEQIF